MAFSKWGETFRCIWQSISYMVLTYVAYTPLIWQHWDGVNTTRPTFLWTMYISSIACIFTGPSHSKTVWFVITGFDGRKLTSENQTDRYYDVTLMCVLNETYVILSHNNLWVKFDEMTHFRGRRFGATRFDVFRNWRSNCLQQARCGGIISWSLRRAP